MLVRGKLSDEGTPGYPFHGGFVRAPLGIQRPTSDSGNVRSLGGLFQLSGIDDDGEVFLVVLVVVVQVEECGPVGGGYAGAGHAPHLNVVRRG